MSESELGRKFRHFRRDLRHRIQYLLACGPLFGLMVLPYRGALKVGGALGALAHRLACRERQRAYEQMSLSLGQVYNQSEIQAYVRGCFVNLGKALVEVIHLKRRGPKHILDWVSCANEQVLSDALAEGGGVIIITGHIGNWEYFAGYLGQRGYPLTVLARENPVPAFDRLLNDIRISTGFRPLNRGTIGSAKESLKVLKKGEILGILIDQDTKVDGVFVDFFGRPAWTPVGAASLALKTGAAVLVGAIIRQSDERHIIHFEGPWRFQSSVDKKQAQVEITAQLTKEIERIISKHPDHWVWMHRRWKRRPEDVNVQT